MGQRAAKDLGVPFLGAIPLDPEMRKAADEGRPFLIRSPGMARDNPTWKQVDAVMENLVRIVEEGKAADAPGKKCFSTLCERERVPRISIRTCQEYTEPRRSTCHLHTNGNPNGHILSVLQNSVIRVPDSDEDIGQYGNRETFTEK
ncbi:hypothetical protein MKMG_02031 [Methanogenium sp. MK-MG]|nr:hypothetical protein MKMG_02031 [Methanogenium sp. MK-MG]